MRVKIDSRFSAVDLYSDFNAQADCLAESDLSLCLADDRNMYSHIGRVQMCSRVMSMDVLLWVVLRLS